MLIRLALLVVTICFFASLARSDEPAFTGAVGSSHARERAGFTLVTGVAVPREAA